MQANEIQRFQMAYHRNGVGGLGGYWCTFEAPDDDNEPRRFAGYLWHTCTEGGFSRTCPDECEADDPNEAAVILIGELVGLSNGGSPDELGAWRSTDYFLPALLPHFQRAKNAWFAQVWPQETADRLAPLPA